MHETTFSHSHVEAPAAGATVAPGRQVLRGWVWPKPGGHFVDVRARVGGRIFPGVHGRPRADLAAHFRTGRPFALAEFSVAVEFAPGPVEVVLEVLELEGVWSAFQTVAYRAEGPAVDAVPAPAPHPWRWHDFTRGLELILRTRRTRPEAPWALLASEIADDLPPVHDLLPPPQPFIGHADEPSVVNASRFGLVLVVGYLFHTTGSIRRLWATADLQTMEPLKLGRATANLIPHFPQYPVAGVSGYEGYVHVPAQLPNPVAVRLYAETVDGTLHLVQIRTTRCHDSGVEKYPWTGATAAEFAAALAAWRGALSARGHPLIEDDEYRAAVERLRAGYLRPAPRAVKHRRPAATPPPARPPARIILASHNLNLEGAPLFLLDLARHLAAAGAALTVVSPGDGVLREAFAACGARVVLVDAGPVFRAADAAAAQAALAALGRAFDFGAADLVITNTFTAFWAVHAAKAAGARVLSYVHESTTPAAFYREHVPPAVVALAESALVLADAVSFTSDATRSHHAGPGQSVNAVLSPGWVDLRRIDAWLAANPREALRARFGVQPDQLLVTNVGTVCDRKGQLGFVRAVDLFNRRNPALAARTKFILLGGRDSPFDDLLAAVLADLALPNLAVHPETPDFLGYYAAADLTVCSSYEESSPRVVFEAMACGTPLLASAIPGIAEIARDGLEAALVPPGDTPAWAEALARLLLSPEIGRDLAPRARARVAAEFAADIVLPRHVAVARAVAAGEFPMNETAGRQFDVEVHPAGWAFPAGKSWLAGWIFAGENRFVTDLRAWIDGRPFLGLHGLPKPGLDERFLNRPGPPYSGWVIQVEPHRGAALLRLEARDPAGDWTEFFRAAITVAADAPACPPSAPLSGRLAELAPALLRRHTQRPAAPFAALADEVVSAALSIPLNSLPNPPFHGALEEPRDTGWLRYGRLSVTGWLAHRTQQIRRITALADAVQESPLLHGLARADIGHVFADLPGREHSQFVGHVDLPANQGAPALLKVFAELENGEKHLAFAQRFTPRVIAGADTPLPPLSKQTFARALWALRGAARRHGLPSGPPGALLAAARAAWAAYQAEAPAKVSRRRVPPPPAPVTGDQPPLRILLVTHNLNFEGAPWFVFELARFLARQPGSSVRVLSPQEGPMRRVFEAAGMPVEVVDLSAALAAASPGGFDAALRAAVKIDWSRFDLLVANTMVSFWAVHLAHAAGKPSLLYVHESSSVRRFFEPLLPAALFPLVEAAFRDATRVVFTADSSRMVFDYLDGGNFRLLPSWVDVARIDAFAAAHDKAALRRKHGLDPAAVLLVNIGSICERKGQHIFLRAAELLRVELLHTYPGRRIQWVMVGARPGVYLDSLQQEAALHGLDNVVFLPESGEIHDFYRLADVFVCTSFEESFPRVLLESAAFRLPIVSTNVNGIAEMLAPDEAWLTAPGDRYQLAEAVKAALAAHFAGDTGRAERARAAITRRFHEMNSLPQHAALAREAVRP